MPTCRFWAQSRFREMATSSNTIQVVRSKHIVAVKSRILWSFKTLGHSIRNLNLFFHGRERALSNRSALLSTW